MPTVELQKVKEAFDHVRKRFPQVTHVFYSAQGRWCYFEAPSFLNEDINVSLLEDAACAAYVDQGWPAAYWYALI